MTAKKEMIKKMTEYLYNLGISDRKSNINPQYSDDIYMLGWNEQDEINVI